MYNEKILFPFLKELYDKINNEDFIIDKNGSKIVEIIAPRIELDPSQPYLDFGAKKSNEKYIQKELEWYKSQDLNINGWVDNIKIWREVSDKDGFINSNYGWCIWSKKNKFQYENTLNTLKNHKESRQAIMIYNRPSMHIDYNFNGMSDFICTMYHHFMIRNNQLISIYNMRSNDAIFGWFNDFAWGCYIHNSIFNDLKKYYLEIELGKIIWISNSFHIYERHFTLIKDIVENYDANF